jgi:hypothetical protein
VAAKPERTNGTPEAQLRAFIDSLDSKDQKVFRSVRAAVRKRFPTANELAYRYPDSVVIGYSPTERGIDGIVSIAARTDGVRLYLMNGPRLPDPKRLLLGSGKQARFVRLEAARRLADPDVDALIGAAVEQASVPFPSEGRGTLIIRSAAAKQPPKRKAAK